MPHVYVRSPFSAGKIVSQWKNDRTHGTAREDGLEMPGRIPGSMTRGKL